MGIFRSRVCQLGMEVASVNLEWKSRLSIGSRVCQLEVASVNWKSRLSIGSRVCQTDITLWPTRAMQFRSTWLQRLLPTLHSRTSAFEGDPTPFPSKMSPQHFRLQSFQGQVMARMSSILHLKPRWWLLSRGNLTMQGHMGLMMMVVMMMKCTKQKRRKARRKTMRKECPMKVC